jgi:hypothetical protein
MTQSICNYSIPEPNPIANQSPSIHDLVRKDIGDRKQFGLDKYKTTLQPNNGRDALVDAYQEALDLCCYLRQAIAERDGINTD